MKLTIRQLTCRGLMLWLLPSLAFAQPCADWPMWRAFSHHFIQSDGRVLADESPQRYSTSEGQAYALFFSLVANDRSEFDRLLIWTRDNLIAGELGTRLPAWQWGKRADGTWGVVDQNSASDADSWLAYTLFEAGRLWHEPRYTAQGNQVLANIRVHLIRDIPSMGWMLMPAEIGFNLSEGGANFNPSYYPVQLLRAFVNADPAGPWGDVIENSVKMIKYASPKGYAPDWVAYIPGQGYTQDPHYGAIGSYDAIRVYLWWGMLAKQDPVAARLRTILYGMNLLIPGKEMAPPLSVNAKTGEISGIGPPGFSAALLPYFATMENKLALHLQNERLIAHRRGGLIGQYPRYYDQVLTLFGQGWMEHRFSFTPQGQLVAQWNSSCSSIK